jgi:hypothetical protein|tara:strand:+ start:3580 stop:3879 length:300 start_codon:yes stop_codon:yes gene_type:complete
VILTYVTIYLLTGAVSLLGLTLLSQFKMANNLWFRVISGGTFGGFSSWYLQGWTPSLSYLEACINGELGLGGYAFLLSINILSGVWIWNLMTTKRTLVV